MNIQDQAPERAELKAMGKAQRHTFTGTFQRRGKKIGYRQGAKPTVLLVDIHASDGKLVTDHLWFNYTKGFQAARLRPGDVVQFDARVAEYSRGYIGHRAGVNVPVSHDYKLSFPTKIKVISRAPRG